MPFYLGKSKIDGLNVGVSREKDYYIDQAEQAIAEKAVLEGEVTELEEEVSTLENEIVSLETAESEGKTLIAGAITNKGVDTVPSDSYQTMADNINSLETGGVTLNGVLEKCKAASGNVINAGDFVSYSSNDSTINIITDRKSTNEKGDSVILSDTQTLITYIAGNSNHMARVVNIDSQGVATVGEGAFPGVSYTSGYLSVVKLTPSKVLFLDYNNTDYQLSGVVGTINGTTITMGTVVSQLCATNESGRFLKTTALSDSRVFAAFSRYWGYVNQVGTLVIDVDGTTPTLKSSSLDIVAGYPISIVKLTDGRVVLFYRGDDNYYKVYAAICTVDNSTGAITVNTSKLTVFNTNYSAYEISTIEISPNKILMLRMTTYTSGTRDLTASILTVSNNRITVESNTVLEGNASYMKIIEKLSDTEVLIMNTKLSGQNTIFSKLTVRSDNSLEQEILCEASGSGAFAGYSENTACFLNKSNTASRSNTEYHDLNILSRSISPIISYSYDKALYGVANNTPDDHGYLEVVRPISKVITFTIEGTPYQAEDGMTWADFIDSDYNIDKGIRVYFGLAYSKDYPVVLPESDYAVANSSGTDQIWSDLIIDSHSYIKGSSYYL